MLQTYVLAIVPVLARDATVCGCTPQCVGARHSVSVHATVCRCTPQCVGTRRSVSVHATVCRCTPHCVGARHSGRGAPLNLPLPAAPL